MGILTDTLNKQQSTPTSGGVLSRTLLPQQQQPVETPNLLGTPGTTNTTPTSALTQADMENEAKGGYMSGGVLSKLGDLLSTGQYAVAGLARKGLEKSGVIPDKGEGGLKKGIKTRQSFVQIVKDVGAADLERQKKLGIENTFAGRVNQIVLGQGGAVAGTESTSVFKNFVREVPATAVGLAGDIFLDPVTYVGGAIGKGVKKTAGFLGKAGSYLVKDVPAAQKIGEVFSRVFSKTRGETEAFRELNMARKVEEGLAAEKNVRLATPIIEAPAAIQQRVNQVLKGGITTRADIAEMAKAVRTELDNVGAAITKVAPELLDEGTFAANKGTYLGNFYRKFVAPTEAEEAASAAKTLFSSSDSTAIRAKDIAARKNFADELIKETDNYFKLSPEQKAAVLERVKNPAKLDTITDLEKKIVTLNKELAAAGGTSEKAIPGLTEQIEKIRKEIDSLGKKLEVEPLTVDKRIARLQKGVDKLTARLGNAADLPAAEARKLKQQLTQLTKNKEILDTQAKIIKEKNLDKLARQIVQQLEKNKNVLSVADFETQGSARRLSQLVNIRVREGAGLIKEGGINSLLTLQKTKRIEIRARFFNNIVEKGITSETPFGAKKFQLPDTKSYGAAAGKFVDKPTFDAIMSAMKTNDDGITKFYNKALRTWKAFKTAYNPATIARNDLTNWLILNPMGGVGAHRLDVYLKTLQEFNKEDSALWNSFKQVGGGLSSQAAAELTDRALQLYNKDSNLKKFFGSFQKFHNKVVDFYGNQDTFFKFANYIKGVTEDGLAPIDALKRANFYLVDYSEVPKFVEWLRKTPFGAPFISFTYGVSLPFAKTLLENPAKLANYYKTLRAIQSLSDGVQVDESAVPDNLKGLNGLKLPFRDKYGRAQYVDLRFILPTNVLEPLTLSEFGLGNVPLANQFGQNPGMQVLAGLLTNRNVYTGKDIIPPGSTNGEATMAVIDYVQKILLPSLMPGAPVRVNGQRKLGGFGVDKLDAAITNRPDYAGRERSLPTTLLDVLGGIKIQPVDEKLNKAIQTSEFKKQLEDIKQKMFKVQLSKTLTPKEKAAEFQRLQTKIRELADEFKNGK